VSPILGIVFEDLSQYKIFAAPLSVIEDLLVMGAFTSVALIAFIILGVILGFIYASFVLRNPIRAFVPTVRSFFLGFGEILALLLRLLPFFIVAFVPMFALSGALDRIGEINRFGINDRNASQVGAMLWFLWGVALLACWFLWPSLRRVRAIAKLSFMEALRGRILYVFILFFIPFLFAGWYLDKTPEAILLNLCGFVNTAMTYILMPLVIFMASMSLPNEIQARIVQTVVTKPVRRSEIVLGRSLGYIGVFTLVLLGMGGVSLLYIYSQLDESQRKTLWVARRPIFSNYPVPEVVADFQKQGAGAALLQRPELFSLMFNQNGKWNHIATNVGKEWAYRYHIGGQANHSAHYGFRFDPKVLATRQNARGEDCHVLQMEFDVFKMTKGDPTREEGKDAEESGVRCLIEVRDRGRDSSDGSKAPTEAQVHRINHQRVTEMLVPTKIFDNKFIEVVIKCTTRSQFVGMARGDLYLLAKDGDFAVNFFKGLATIWLKMVLVVCVAVSASTALKGFVTVLFASAVYVLGLFYFFMWNVAAGALGTVKGGGPIESFIRLATQQNQVSPLDESNFLIRLLLNIDQGLLFLMRLTTFLVPDLSKLDVAQYVAHGVDVPGVLILRNVVIVTAYVIPVMVVGYFFLRNRELAA
jgi:hypothetical protein